MAGTVHKLRRPAVGPTSDGSYFLSWAYDDVPSCVATVEVDSHGHCEWFVQRGPRGDLGDLSEGQGSVDAVVAALAAEMTVFSARSVRGKSRVAPLSPEILMNAKTDRVHIEKGKLISAVPLKTSKPKPK